MKPKKNEKEINQIKANRLKVYTNEKDDDENGFVRIFHLKCCDSKIHKTNAIIN